MKTNYKLTKTRAYKSNGDLLHFVYTVTANDGSKVAYPTWETGRDSITTALITRAKDGSVSAWGFFNLRSSAVECALRVGFGEASGEYVVETVSL